MDDVEYERWKQLARVYGEIGAEMIIESEKRKSVDGSTEAC
jgi:hypothetical protein